MLDKTPLNPHDLLGRVGACISLLRSLEEKYPHNPNGSPKNSGMNNAGWDGFDRVKRQLEETRRETAETGRALVNKMMDAGGDALPILRLVQRVEEVADGLNGLELLNRHDFRNDLSNLVTALRAEQPLIEAACIAARKSRATEILKAANTGGGKLVAPAPSYPPTELQTMCDARARVLEAARQRSSAVPRFIGDSPSILNIWPNIEAASKNALPVLLVGEPGTGKELVAGIIHFASTRRGPFNACNCGGLSEERLEDDLFGHVTGAFTGADRDRDGLFRASENGTLFLDEVADMPAKVQAGILRALDPGKIRPLGSDVEIPVHVCIIAATNKDLQKERDAGRFRRDLWSRLCSSLTIELPPLRQRVEDFGPLVEHFAKGRKPTDKWLAELRSKSWEDGNVRDLKHAVEGALDRADVWQTPEQQERSERDRIVTALREKKTKRDAAGALDISRPTLDAKIETYGIHDDEWKTSTPG